MQNNPSSRQSARPPRRITLFAFWGLGDAILLTPLIRSLKQRYPESEIHLVGKAFLKELFLHDPSVDKITVYTPPWTAGYGRKYRFWSRDYRNLMTWLRENRDGRDWIIATRDDVREHALARMMGGVRRIGYAGNVASALLTHPLRLPSPRIRNVHYADCNRRLAHALGCPDDGLGPQVVLTQEERDEAMQWLFRTGWSGQRPIVGLHLGAGSPIRQWPVQRFQDALQHAAGAIAHLVVLADPEGLWRSFTPPAGLAAPCTGEAPLRKLLAVLSHVDVLLCNDSGIMHAAAALGVRVVAVFGPGSLDLFRPYGKGHRVACNDRIPCRPCFDKCSHKHPICMQSVTAGHVAEALRAVSRDLNSPSARQICMAGGQASW